MKKYLDDYTPEKPCLKQVVKAMIVTTKGEKIFGSNGIQAEVSVCPRVEQNMQTGQGYHLCKEVCQQGAHAEVAAIKNAKLQGVDITGASLFLTGHTYCCDNCLKEMKLAGIKRVEVLDSGKVYNL